MRPCRRIADALVDLGARTRQAVGVAEQQPDRPGERVGGRVLAGEQHRQHVAVDFVRRDPRLRIVGGDDHRLEQVLGRGAARRVLEAGSRRGDEALDRRGHRGDAAIELAVGGRLPPAPGRQRSEHPPEDRREDLVEMLLDDVAVGLERIDLGTECEPGDGVHGVAHQVALQVDRRAGVGGSAPAAGEALAHRHQRRKVGAQVARIEARHHHPPLPLPDLALGAEDADRRADLGRDLGQLLGAAKAVGPVAHQRAHRRVVGDRHDAAVAELEAEAGTVLLHPALDLLVDARAVDLQQVADDSGRPGGAGSSSISRSRGGAAAAVSIGMDMRCSPVSAWRAPRPCAASGGRARVPSRASSRCCACRARPCPWRGRSRP